MDRRERKPRSKWRIFSWGAALVLLALLLLWVFHPTPDSHVTVVNKSGTDIGSVTIVIACNKPFMHARVPVGHQFIMRYKARCDSDYAVSIVFADKTMLAHTSGYITNGLIYNDRIVVTRTAIDLISNEPFVAY